MTIIGIAASSSSYAPNLPLSRGGLGSLPNTVLLWTIKTFIGSITVQNFAQFECANVCYFGFTPLVKAKYHNVPVWGTIFLSQRFTIDVTLRRLRPCVMSTFTAHQGSYSLTSYCTDVVKSRKAKPSMFVYISNVVSYKLSPKTCRKTLTPMKIDGWKEFYRSPTISYTNIRIQSRSDREHNKNSEQKNKDKTTKTVWRYAT